MFIELLASIVCFVIAFIMQVLNPNSNKIIGLGYPNERWFDPQTFVKSHTGWQISKDNKINWRD